MNSLKPIFTEPTQCQDCYKCLRHCPVKAIKVENGIARVMSDMCIYCGRCVEVCPAGAKQIRDDLSRAKQLLKKKEKVIVSLAPSWVSEFENVKSSQMISGLINLGFSEVSETALGAQIVSKKCSDILSDTEKGVFISSACPVVVDYLAKYKKEQTSKILRFYSPILAHAKLLRQHFGDEIGIVFVSPCIAKKKEADENQGLLDVSITFKDLKNWFKEEGIELKHAVESKKRFEPYSADEGNLYPIDGGMIEGIKHYSDHSDVNFMAFSGIDNIKSILDGLEKSEIDKKIFLELLSCNGGCINGPAMSSKSGLAKRRLDVELNENDQPTTTRASLEDIDYEIEAENLLLHQATESEIYYALKKIGKYSRNDELNCGGCGYYTCREFAEALIANNAEPSMCVSYMRKLALNKANALLQKMPSGVVIVNNKLRIVECNKKFVEIVGGNAEVIFEVNPHLEGAFLDRVIPFAKHFKNIFYSETKELVKDVKYNDKILRLTIFEIDRDRIIGGIIQDITDPYVQRDHIINKAKEVIKKNLTTVQQIAFLLGENASESEILLQQIIDSFSGNKSGTVLDKESD